MTEAEKKRYDDFRAKQAAKRTEEWRQMWRLRLLSQGFTILIPIQGFMWTEIK